MNRGNIPGFYYDEEKKKYFKITANHAAPVDAKYSRTNVQREQREKRDLKKRKMEDRLARTQTVHRAAVLQSPLLSTALKREIGLCTAQNLRSSQDDAIVGSLEYSRMYPRLEGVQAWSLIVDTAVHQDRILFTTTSRSGFTRVNSYEWDDSISSVHQRILPLPVVSLQGEFVTMQLVSSTLLLVTQHMDTMHYYLGDPGAGDFYSTGALGHPLGKSTIKAHACAYEPYTQNIAFAGLGLLVVNDGSPGHLGRCDFKDTMESFAVTWLQPNVLAYGLQSRTGHRTTTHTVRLWDIRVGNGPSAANSSNRIKRRHRVTGLERWGPNDHHLLVTSNKDISLYDLRMQSTDGPPLLTIAHTSAGAKLNFAVHGDLIAATDELFKVQVYSLRTSRHLRTLGPHAFGTPPGQLRWQEDERGAPYLQACHNNDLHKWAY